MHEKRKKMKGYHSVYGIDGHKYYFATEDAKTRRVSENDFLATKNPWVVVTRNPHTKKPKFVYMQAGNKTGTYEIAASSFFENTSGDLQALHTISDVIHKHHTDLTMPEIGNHVHAFHKTVTTTAAPIAVLQPQRSLFIPMQTDSKLTCFTEANLAAAREYKQRQITAGAKNIPHVKDTFKACVDGTCTYVLTVTDGNEQQMQTRLSLEEKLKEFRPKLIKHWFCNDDKYYLLHNVVAGEIGKGESFSDKQKLKNAVRTLVSSIHSKGVFLGGKISGETILYKGNSSGEYQVVISDLTEAIVVLTSTSTAYVTAKTTDDDALQTLLSTINSTPPVGGPVAVPVGGPVAATPVAAAGAGAVPVAGAVAVPGAVPGAVAGAVAVPGAVSVT
jgi:hypothetical protein